MLSAPSENFVLYSFNFTELPMVMKICILSMLLARGLLFLCWLAVLILDWIFLLLSELQKYDHQ